MVKIVVGNYIFDNSTILDSPKLFVSNSMVSETLEADEFSFSVESKALGFMPLITAGGDTFLTSDQDVFGFDDGDIRSLPYGTQALYYEDDVLKYKFFVKRIERIARYLFSFECLSLVGLLSSVTHEGRVYKGERAGSIVAEIMGNLDYEIDEELASTPVYNWLPIDTARNNLQQLLFSLGGSILKTENGGINICFNRPTYAVEIGQDVTYMGGTYQYLSPATKVTVTEHAFYDSDAVEEVVLYDNTQGVTAENYRIIFEIPYHSYRSEGITIAETHDNFIIVNGTGIVYGKPYVHVTRTITKDTGVEGEELEVKVSDAYLVNSLNSNNVLERVAAYYSQASEIRCAFVHGRELTGDLISFTDPFGDEVQGYIKEMTLTVSNTTKADAVIATNWKPNHLGNGFTKFMIVTNDDLVDGVWSVPSELVGKNAQVVLFSGAQGGQGGFAGGTIGLINGSWSESWETPHRYDFMGNINGPTDGAPGGAGGQGGRPGRIIQANVVLAASYNVEFGEGGEGGAGGTANRNQYYQDYTTQPQEGALGEHSVFGSYDTDNGIEFFGNYINMISGDIYARVQGETGIPGAAGGRGGTGAIYITAPMKTEDFPEYRAKDGLGVGEYIGGAGSREVGWFRKAYVNLYDRGEPDDPYYFSGVHGGGGGGGAAMGANGNDGTFSNDWTTWTQKGRDEDLYTHGSYRDRSSGGYVNVYASFGGNGADVNYIPPQTTLGNPGTGGAGGGGGGGASVAFGYATSTNHIDHGGAAWGGKGGNGGQGGKGSDGFALIYYGDE